MKKILIAVICLFSLNAFAQDFDGRHKRHRDKTPRKNDYFTAGLYTGTYDSRSFLTVDNHFFNLVGVELEYYKFSDLSLVVKGLYQFTSYNVSSYSTLISKEPSSYIINFNINGRYYLGRKKVNPYLQLGISQETSFRDEYKSTFFDEYSGVTYTNTYSKSYEYRTLLNFGVGFKVNLGKKFAFDMKYDIYKTLARNARYGDGFNGFSVLAGIKYEL